MTSRSISAKLTVTIRRATGVEGGFGCLLPFHSKYLAHIAVYAKAVYHANGIDPVYRYASIPIWGRKPYCFGIPQVDFSFLEKIKKELKAFDKNLAKKPQLISLGKMDLAEGEEALSAFKKARPRTKIHPFSAVTGRGLTELKWAVWHEIVKYKKSQAEKAAGNGSE